MQRAKLGNHVQDQRISPKQSLYPGSVTNVFAVTSTGLYPGENGQGDETLFFCLQATYRKVKKTSKNILLLIENTVPLNGL